MIDGVMKISNSVLLSVSSVRLKMLPTYGKSPSSGVFVTVVVVSSRNTPPSTTVSPLFTSTRVLTEFVAMAGTHQVWSVDTATGRSRAHSGAGGEDIRDGDNQNALLAQPMGIEARGERVYFADAESNAIRWADASEDGVVGTIVGTGLFDFGDVDGKGDDVRLQHAQGLAFRRDGALLVADSYNDCIKVVDIEARTSSAWVRGLHEPSGIACSATHAYVADTNAHRIAVLDLANGDMNELKLE